MEDDATHYHATFTATNGIDDTGSVTIDAGKFTDAATNDNVAATQYAIVYDSNSPTTTISTAEPLDPTNTNPIPFTVTFSEEVAGFAYTDIVITCLIDYGEPAGQQAFDNTANFDGTYVFDELGLKAWNGVVATGKLLTHVIFHPVQKSLNRLIQIDYTIRIQTITNLSGL